MLPNPEQRRELKLIFDVARIAHNYANKRVKERIAANGMHGPLGSAAFAARLPKDFAYWRDTIKTLGIVAE